MDKDSASHKREAIDGLMSFFCSDLPGAAKSYEFCVRDVFTKLYESYETKFFIGSATYADDLNYCKDVTGDTQKKVLREINKKKTR